MEAQLSEATKIIRSALLSGIRLTTAQANRLGQTVDDSIANNIKIFVICVL